jgi:Family of unknown function (DUF6064)
MMGLPFTHDQFLDVFAAYNSALGPAVVLLWLVTLAALLMLLRGRLKPWMAGALLAVHWAWSGIAYHWAYFAAINPAARVFGALFVVQALLVLWFGVRRPGLAVTWGRRGHQRLSAFFCAFALAYPFLAMASGMHWPRMPAFAVPCPTTLLTVGLLVGLEPRHLRGLFVIPLLWCLVAGSAALQLGILPDFMLFAGAVALLVYGVAPRLLGSAEPA